MKCAGPLSLICFFLVFIFIPTLGGSNNCLILQIRELKFRKVKDLAPPMSHNRSRAGTHTWTI